MNKFILIIIVCCLGFTGAVSSQEVLKENLSKKVLNFYDYNKSKIESEGFYYVDPLGETTLKHGRWKYYDRMGVLVEVRHYYKNQPHGLVTVYYPNRKKSTEGFFILGEQDSIYTAWYESGKIKETGFFEKNSPVGKWKYNYIDGNSKLVENIVDDEHYVESFWLPDSLHTQTITAGTGNMATYYTNGKLKAYYTYKDGLKNGPFEEASIYGYYLMKGEFKENQKSGEWKYFYYTGDLEKITHYANDKLDGDYTYYYDNGKVNVEGKYKNGNKEGTWFWYTNQGKIDMSGSFKNDLMHGDWVYNYPTGELSYEAKYKENLKEGKWTYYYKDGSTFKQGTFKNDMKNGLWQTWYESGKILMEGKYVDDKEEGIWKNYWDTGNLKNQATFTAGKLNGEWLSFYPSGKAKTKGNYQEEMKVGEWTEFFENGKPKDVGNYKIKKDKSKVGYGPMKDREKKTSVKHGNWVSYSAQDYKLTQTGEYKNGLKDGEWIAYYPGGRTPVVVSNYKNGKLHGKMTEYRRRGGKLRSETNYKDGLKHGKVIIYDKRGRQIAEQEYDNGVKVIKGSKNRPGSFSPN